MELSGPVVVQHQGHFTLTLDFQVKFWKCCISGIGCLIDMKRKGCELIGCLTHIVTLKCDLNLTSPMTLTLDFQGQNFDRHILGMGRSIDLEWKRCELDTMVDCTMGLLLGHSAWQIDWPSNGSMWNSYSFQPVNPWMGYSFTDLGAEGCCHSLNALFNSLRPSDAYTRQ